MANKEPAIVPTVEVTVYLNNGASFSVRLQEFTVTVDQLGRRTYSWLNGPDDLLRLDADLVAAVVSRNI